MAKFTVHTTHTAPAGSKDRLEGIGKAFGFLPNLAAVLAESPAALEGYFTLSDIFGRSDLTPTERQVVLLATSVENGCEYCVAAHTAIAGMSKVPDAVIAALRNGTAIADPKLEALRGFTAKVVRDRGLVGEAAVASFLAAGYSKGQMLDVILGVTQKTLSNYVNHIAATPVDHAFASVAWSRNAACAR